MDFPLVIL